jgi:lipoate-protein ligase A
MFDYEYWGTQSFDARTNMALEELMLRQAAEKKKAMARFYSFDKDSVVLGYSQATDALKKRDVDVVRRATGGSHVQTGSNIIAYSFAVPRDGSFSNFEDMRGYYAENIANAFTKLGLENVLIDNKASSVNINDKVSAAHAVIWGVESALIHGLITIDPYEIGALAERLYLATRKIGTNEYSEYDAIRNIPAISKVLPRLAENLRGEGRREAIKKILAETILAEVTRGKHENKKVDQITINQAIPLLERRYGKEEWTEQRSPVFTEEEIETIPGEELNGKLKENLGYCMYIQVSDNKFKKMVEDDN